MPRKTTFKRFDARPMLAKGQPPLAEILDRAAKLKAGEGLVVLAPFLPAPLIDRLRGEGFQCRTEAAADGSWKAYFWRDTPPGSS
jgi:hypothetical protein